MKHLSELITSKSQTETRVPKDWLEVTEGSSLYLDVNIESSIKIVKALHQDVDLFIVIQSFLPNLKIFNKYFLFLLLTFQIRAINFIS